MELNFIEGEPPMGFSFVTMDELPMNPYLWYLRARRNGSDKEFLLSRDSNDYFVLWVRKNKNDKAGRVGWRTFEVQHANG